MNTTQKNPYIGPRTFQKEEGHLFFGREREARDLIALVASEQLVLFYAQSGAGKSSIVNTRLIPSLERKDYEVLPVGRVSGDVAAGNEVDNVFVYNLVRGLVQHKAEAEILTKLSLAQFLAGLNSDDKGYFYDEALVGESSEPVEEGTTIIRRALIIDQFEELLSTHPEAWEKREDFFAQLAQAMQEDPYLWVVLVMREDYIAGLDPYAHHLTSGLRVRYYMQRLGREAALSAVKSPVEDLRPYAQGVAEKLVDDLCSIKVQKPDGTPDVQPGQYVEPVQLQVVCYGLWANLSPEGKQITEKDLQDVGDVNQSLGKYYEKRVSEVAKTKNVKERLIREWFEKKLITAGGIRNMVLQEPNKKSGGLDDEVIQALQSDLVRAEKRGGATWYELTHDRLVEPILERNKQWFNENLSPLQRQAALWKDQDQNENWLLRDDGLADVEAWANSHQDELIDIESEFLEACRKVQAQIEERHAAEQQKLMMANKLAEEQARSAKRARLFNFISLGLVLIAIAVTIYAFDQKNKAQGAQTEAIHQSDIARSSELSTIALDRSNSQLDLALLLGVQANSFNSNPQTQKTLLSLSQKSGRYQGSIKGKEEDIQEIQYSPDGKTIASRDKNGITLWNADTLEPLNDTPLNGHYYGVSALALSNDGKFLASGANDGTIVIWDASTRQMLSKPFKAHTYQVSSLAFSSDGKTLASASSSENAINLWDMTDPANPQQIGGPLAKHSNGITKLVFSPDGKTLASSSYDGSIILWDLTTRKPYNDKNNEMTNLGGQFAFNSKGTLLVSTGNYTPTLTLWDVTDPAKPKKYDKELTSQTGSAVYTLSISPDDKTLAAAYDDGTIRLWDLSGDLTDPNAVFKNESLKLKGSSANSLAFSADSKTLASGSNYDGAIVLWDVATHEQVSEIAKRGSSAVSAVIFGSDKKTLITASTDSTISYWDISDLKQPSKIGDPLQGHPGQPNSMVFSPDGSLLYSYGDDGAILIDVKTQQPIGLGYSLANSDGSVLWYQTLDRKTGETTIHLRDGKSGEDIGMPFSGQNPAFSPDGKLLEFQTSDEEGHSQFHLWDITGNKELASPQSGDYLAFSPNSQMLVFQTTDQAAGEDTSRTYINLWSVSAGEKVGKPVEGSYVGFSPNSKTLLYQTSNGATGEVSTIFLDVAKLAVIKAVTTSITVVNGLAYYNTTNPASGLTSLNLVDTTTGEALVPPIENANYQASSADGKILIYQIYDGPNNKNTIYVVNTQTGALIGAPVDANFYTSQTFGQIFVYSNYTYNPTNGTNDFSFVPINTSTASLPFGDAIKGQFPNVVQDGRVLISQSSDGKQLNLTNGQYGGATSLQGTYLATSSDGKILVYQIFENNTNFIKLWDLVNNKAIGEPIPGTYLSLNPDGTTLATLNENKAIIFWDVTKTWPLGNAVTEKTATVSSAALSLDGKTLAYSDESGIHLQDTAGDKIASTLTNKHVGSVNSVTLSPDKKTLLSFGEDGKAILWDLNTFKALGDPITGTYGNFTDSGEYVYVVDGNKNSTTIWSLARHQAIGEPFAGQSTNFSPDEKFIAVADGTKNTIALWDITRQKAVGEPLTGQSVIFSPDSKTLAVIDGAVTSLWDLTTLQIMGEPIKGTTVIFSPDSKTAALYFYNGVNYTTTLFDLTARQVINEPIYGSVITSSKATDTFIVVDSTKNTTTFWDWKTRKPFGKSISGSDAFLTGTKIDVLFVRDNVNSKTTLWNPVTREQIGKTLTGIYSPNSYSADNTLMSIYGSNNDILLWDLSSQKQFGSAIKGAFSPIFCADNKTVAWFDSANTTVNIWDLETDQPLGEHILGEQSANYGAGLSFNAACTVLAIGDLSENKTTLWDLTTNESIGKPFSGSTALFSPDGSTVLIYDSYNGRSSPAFWNVADTSQIDTGVQGNYVNLTENSNIVIIQRYDQNIGWLFSLWSLNNHTQIGDEGNNYPSSTFTSDGKLIVAGKDGVIFWDADKNKMVDQPLQGHSSPISNMLFNADGRILATLASDGIVLTDLDKQSDKHLDTGKFLGKFNETLTTFPNGRTMAFSPDGKSFTALSKDGTIFSWDIASDPPVLLHDPVDAPYKDFINNVSQLVLSPDGKYVVYESNGKLKIWDIDKKKPVGGSIDIPNSSNGGGITFSPDGKSMFYNDGGTIFQWDGWNSSAKAPKDGPSFGNNSFSSLTMLMDPNELTTPKYLISTSSDQSNNVATQIWDWLQYSKVGDPISGTLQVLGSNAQTKVLVYKDNNGRLVKWDLNPGSWSDLLCGRAKRNLTRDEWKEYVGDPARDKNAPPYVAVCPQYSTEPAPPPTAGPTP